MISGSGHYQLRRAGRVIIEGDFKNAITPEGQAAFVAAAFAQSPVSDKWYYGLIGAYNDGFGTATGTMASHPAWTEAACGPLLRPELGDPTFSFADVTHPYYVRENIDIVMREPGDIVGIFIVSTRNVGGSDGVIWSKASLQNFSTLNVIAEDIFRIQYKMSIQDNDTTIGAEYVT